MRLPDFILRRLPARPSTRAFWRAALARKDSSLWEALHGYIYLRSPRLYIRIGMGRGKAARMLQEPLYKLGRLLGWWGEDAGKRFADTYHAKVMPVEQARRFLDVGRPLDLEVPEKVLPYPMARRILRENPGDIALFDCPCRGTVEKPCLPLDVCVIVGQPFVDFALEHHPGKARRVSVEEALEVIRAEHERGHVSHAFFKEAVLGRFYAICNCCACCCAAMQTHRRGVPMLASSGYVCTADEKRCIGCGECARACPFTALSLRRDEVRPAAPAKKSVPPAALHLSAASEEGASPAIRGVPVPTAGSADRAIPRPADDPRSPRGLRKVVIDRELCLGCGVCTSKCPKDALRLERDPSKPEPLDI